MRKWVIVVLVLLISFGAYWFFLKDLKFFKPGSVWDLVPASATAIYESTDLVRSWNSVQGLDVWKELEKIPEFKKQRLALNTLDSLSGRNGSLDRILRGRSLLIAIHPISRQEFDFLYLLEYNPNGGDETMEKILGHYLDNGFSRQERQYRGTILHELRNTRTGEILTWFEYKGYLAVSFTPFLVEDVVRVVDGEPGFSHREAIKRSERPASGSKGKLFLDLGSWDEWKNLFLAQHESGIFNAGLLTLDLDASDGAFSASGFISGENGGGYWASLLGQSAIPSTLPAERLPYTSQTHHLLLSDFSLWQQRANLLSSELDADRAARQRNFSTASGKDANHLTSLMVGELLLYQTESAVKKGRILVMSTQSGSDVLNGLRSIAVPDYQEQFGSIQIGLIKHADWPYLWLGGPFVGFSETYFSVVGNRLVLANSADLLKQYLPLLNRHLDGVPSGGGSGRVLSIDGSMPFLWPGLKQRLNTKWNAFHSRHESILTGFPEWRIDFTPSAQGIQLSAQVQYGGQTTGIKGLGFNLERRVGLGAEIKGAPMVFEHAGRKITLVQSANYELIALGQEGNILWSMNPGAVLGPEIYPIDYFGDGGLFLLFYTIDGRVHLVDQSGNTMADFPKVPEGIQGIQSLSLFDFNMNKDYVLTISGPTGETAMFDRFLNPIERWPNPSLGGVVSSPLLHRRVSGRDIIIGVRRSGLVHAFDPQGQKQQGFPVDLRKRLSNPMVAKGGASLAEASLITISEDGEVIEFTLDGTIKRRDQQVRPTRDSRFFLVPDPSGREYVFVRQDFNQLTVSDASGKELFKISLVPGGTLVFQYFYFSPLEAFLVVSDPVQEFSYIYDRKGELIGGRPVESGAGINLWQGGGQGSYLVQTAYGDQVLVFSFRP